jgi:hypothetical protein
MKPAVAGMPASPSIASVMTAASRGCSAPRPVTARMSSPNGVDRSRITMTANAARFMNRYTAR